MPASGFRRPNILNGPSTNPEVQALSPQTLDSESQAQILVDAASQTLSPKLSVLNPNPNVNPEIRNQKAEPVNFDRRWCGCLQSEGRGDLRFLGRV